MQNASRFLGREYSFCLEVERGSRLGTKLGFPTANQRFPEGMCVPKRGVYAGRCVYEGKSYACVSDVGTKPTVNSGGEVVCETHIFGFSGELYGKKLRVFPREYLRGEKKFENVESLRVQIEADVRAAKAALKRSGALIFED